MTNKSGTPSQMYKYTENYNAYNDFTNGFALLQNDYLK